MNIIFIGPQASGKGTQGKIVAEKMGLCHISMGDLLRNYEGELKSKIAEIINQGNLIPVELSIQIISERIKKEKNCKKGFIFDGFPRNIDQAIALDKIMKIDKVVEIYISDELALKRLSGRLTCSKCGAVFNEDTNPPKKKNVCDVCGGKLYKRPDDNEISIRKRLVVYHNETEPVLNYYKKLGKLLKIDGSQEIDKVTEDILKGLGK